MPTLPPSLRGPVALALAKSSDAIPGPRALTGGTIYELKWDGYRLAVVTGPAGARLWSRNGTDLTDRFPDIRDAATAALPAGSIVDGEVVIWNGDRLDFDLLQRRLVRGPTKAAAEATRHPASFVAFDVLAMDFTDMRERPWQERRARLEALAGWDPPLQLSPYTRDVDQARQWFADYRPAGIEGLVCKGAASRYTSGQRTWVKVKSRASVEVIIGAVIGPVQQPRELVLGARRGDELVIVGRSTPLTAAQARSLAGVLHPGDETHPWPAQISSGQFGDHARRVTITRVRPDVVAEVAADTARHAGRFRHAVRFIRHRPDLSVDDLAEPW